MHATINLDLFLVIPMRTPKLRFSLRTFLILIALVACWLGYQLRIISQRNAMLAQINAQGGEFITYANAQPMQVAYYEAFDLFDHPDPNFAQILNEAKDNKEQISRVREWFGDPPISTITLLQPSTPDISKSKVTELFPEAMVFEVPHALAPSDEDFQTDAKSPPPPEIPAPPPSPQELKEKLRQPHVITPDESKQLIELYRKLEQQQAKPKSE